MSALYKSGILLLSIFFLIHNKASSQASWEIFGKNRIQYEQFEWKYYDSTHFRVFFHGRGQRIAKYVLEQSEEDVEQVTRMMGGRMPRKLNIILYNTYSEFVQTNIGRRFDNVMSTPDGGKVEVVGDQFPIYYSGKREELRKQVRNEVAKIIKDKMLYGDNIKEVIKNAIKMNLPVWYTEGFVEYISRDWEGKDQALIQGLLIKDSSKNFNKLAQEFPVQVGRSFWHFFEAKYGKNNVSNLLYLTRYRKGVHDAIENVLSIKAKEVFNEWKKFYMEPTAQLSSADKDYGRKEATFIPAEFETKQSQFKLSPNGTQVAYIEKKDGEYALKTFEVSDGRTKTLVEGGIKNIQEVNDPDYPLLAWSRDGKKLVYVFEKKNKLYIRMYSVNGQTKKTKEVSKYKMERITGICFAENENALIVSGIRKGQSDLYRYVFYRNRFTPITQDVYDDQSPSYFSSGTRSGILFLSNRPTSSMEKTDFRKDYVFEDHMNIFFYKESGNDLLDQVTNTGNEVSNPVQYGLNSIAYFEKSGGEKIRKIVKIQKGAKSENIFTPLPAAQPGFHIEHQEYQIHNNSLIEVTIQDGGYKIYNTPILQLESFDIQNADSSNMDSPENKTEEKETARPIYYTPFDDTDTTGLLYSIFTNKEHNTRSTSTDITTGSQKLKKKEYRPTFYPEYVVTSLDNSLLYTRYQPFGSDMSNFTNQNLNGFISFNLNDILEDFQVRAGYRLPLNFTGTSYFLEFGNFKKRTDWTLIYFHQNSLKDLQGTNPDSSQNLQLPFRRTATDYFQSKWAYPFSVVSSANFNLGVRRDKISYPSVNNPTALTKDIFNYWAFARVEFIYDNTVNPIYNIMKGTRFKLYAEYYQKFTDDKTNFYSYGIDARNYMTIYRNCILASRFAGGMSNGKSKLLYYLGGVDNPLLSSQSGPPPRTDVDYAFQTTATNLRGFHQQAINGNNYVVINEEIRLPVFNTLLNRQVKSAFLRHLQLIGFMDGGLAWVGQTDLHYGFPGSTFTTITNLAKPFGIGYGTGLRTKLLGMFIRTDIAWNIYNGGTPILHLSLGTDF